MEGMGELHTSGDKHEEMLLETGLHGQTRLQAAHPMHTSITF